LCEILLQSKFGLSMWSQDQRQTTVTTSHLKRALWICVVGSPFVVVGLIPIVTAIREGTPEVALVGILFIGVGLFSMRKGYHAIRQWRVFGTSHLQLETVPVPMGTTLRARVQVPVPPDDPPKEGYQVHVEAQWDKDRWWEGSATVQGESGEGETTLISFSIDLPRLADLPFSPDNDDLDWTLMVTASFEDRLDYEAPFDLPVSAGHDGDERPEDESDASPDTTEEAFWDVGGEEAGLRRADDGGDAGETEDEGTDTGSTDPQ
jgi:hypothetical protein